MKKLKTTGLMMLALVFTPLTSMTASPLVSNFGCASIGGVNGGGKGNAWIDGSEVTVRAFNESYWEAKSGNNTVSISREDDGNPDVSWSGPNRKHGVCLPRGNVDFSGAKKSTSAEPFFSCTAVAKGSVEESTCQSPSLSEMGLALNGAYGRAPVKSNDSPTLRAGQCGWVEERDECRKERDKSVCIARSYSERMTGLHSKWGIKQSTVEKKKGLTAFLFRYTMRLHPSGEF